MLDKASKGRATAILLLLHVAQTQLKDLAKQHPYDEAVQRAKLDLDNSVEELHDLCFKDKNAV